MLIQARKQRGFTLVELMIGLAIVGFLMAAGVPAFSTWSQNMQIRSTAEAIQNGLQQARAEALRRNTSVRFQLTTSIDNTCQLSLNGTNWVINLGTGGTGGTHDPSDLCGTPISQTITSSSTDSAFILQTYSSSGSPHVATSMSSKSNSVVVFNSLGQVSWPLASTGSTCTTASAAATSGNLVCIDVTNPTAGNCASASGPMTCMRIQITVPGGQIKMCNPNISVTGTSAQGC